MSLEQMIQAVRNNSTIPCHSPEALELLDILEAYLTEKRATHAILAADLDAVIALLDRPQPFEAMRPLVSRLAQCLKRALDLPPFELQAAWAAQGDEEHPSRSCPAAPSFAPVADALVALQAQLAHRDTALAEVVAAARRVAQHYTHPSDAQGYLDVDLEALAHALAVWDAATTPREERSDD